MKGILESGKLSLTNIDREAEDYPDDKNGDTNDHDNEEDFSNTFNYLEIQSLAEIMNAKLTNGREVEAEKEPLSGNIKKRTDVITPFKTNISDFFEKDNVGERKRKDLEERISKTAFKQRKISDA